MEASRAAAMYYKLRSEALKAEFQAKGIVIPDITEDNHSDDPFLSGALSRFLVNSDSDRNVYIFAHLFAIGPLTVLIFFLLVSSTGCFCSLGISLGCVRKFYVLGYFNTP
jgi:hypothetical protein